MNMFYLFAAIAIMVIVILRDVLKKKYNFDMDNVNLKDFKIIEISDKKETSSSVIKKNTGTHSLVLVDSGVNKATVIATLRQITGMDYSAAKQIVYSPSSIFMTGISAKEADLTKKALEFVGAKVEIK